MVSLIWGPGGPSPGFMAETGGCWLMVYDDNLQATHLVRPTWTGRWFSPEATVGGGVLSCPDHFDGLTGLGEIGRVSRR